MYLDDVEVFVDEFDPDCFVERYIDPEFFLLMCSDLGCKFDPVDERAFCFAAKDVAMEDAKSCTISSVVWLESVLVCPVLKDFPKRNKGWRRTPVP